MKEAIGCPVHVRPELTEMPARIAALPVYRGYPVPWFVEYVSGEPEFRIADSKKRVRAVREKLCWVCGERLGSYLCFVIGPMCGINRTTSEPPCHLECARWSAVNCPFLTRPRMDRRLAGLPEEAESPGGIGIPRNPGVTLLWITKSYTTWQPKEGGWLIEIGEPVAWEWWAEGKAATLAQVEQSVGTGLPLLMDIAVAENKRAVAALIRQYADFKKLYPLPAMAEQATDPCEVEAKP